MKKVQRVKENVVNLFAFLVIFILLGCETTNKSDVSTTTQGYTQIDQTNPKDKAFYTALV